MREILKILTYLAAVVVGGALLAPPLFWLGRWAVDIDLIPQLDRFGLSKYLNRSVLVVALVLLWPFLKWIGLRSKAELRLEPNPRRWHDLGVGLAAGIVGLSVGAGVMLATEQVSLWAHVRWHKFAASLLTAVTVALIEEAFFRGALFGILRRHLSWQRALAFLSVLFAVLHFIKPNRKLAKIMEVDWLSGFRLLPHSFWQFREPELLIGGLFTLVMVSWVLGYTVVKTRSLYMAIGLHAGWVFALRSFSYHTNRIAPPSIWAGQNLTTGLLATGLILATLGFLAWHLRHRSPGAADPGG